jgi:outer membrane receptor for ferrienterochelin and colicin
LNNSAYKYLDNDESSETNKILDYDSGEIENKLRVENNSRINGYKINFGANAEVISYSNKTVAQRFYDGQVTTIRYNTDLNLLKWGFFGQVSKPILDERLTLSLGVRADANNYSKEMGNLLKQLSPRFSASYRLDNQWSLNFNTGRYFQLPAYTVLGFKKENILVNKSNNLKYITADHLIGGIEFRPETGILFSAEAFLKKYGKYPFSVNDAISLANKGADFGVIGDEEVTSTSEGRAYGAEFQTRITSGKGFNLNLSYTLVRSEFKNGLNQFIPSKWDSKHLIVLTSTKEIKGNWRAGIRWRFVGGLPYTPWDLDKSSLVEVWNLTGSPSFDNSRLNAFRFKPFHQLDVRIDKTLYLKRLTAKFYVDFQNFYNFKAGQEDIIVRDQDEDGRFILVDGGSRYQLRRVKNTTGTFLPSLGIIVEF